MNNENPQNSEKLKLFTNSDLYWDKYWSKIDKAKNFIFIITYDLDNKMIANLTLRKLIEAQERGVQVVLLVEHLNFYMKHSLYKQLKKKGGVIIKPNPIHKIINYTLNLNTKKFFNRCHQKVTLIDNDLFLASLNITNEYSGIKYGSYQFIDLNMYVKNTICYQKILTFFKELIDENSEQLKEGKAEKIEELFKQYLTKKGLFQEQMSNLNSFEQFIEEKPPVKSEIQDTIYDLLESSKESITMIQPYYTNLKRIEDLLINAVKRGVKVKIITAEKRDQTAYKYQYNSDIFSHLLQNGIEVYEFLDKFLHMKAYYVDKKVLTIGSLNNDTTSFTLNNEANYLLKKNKVNEHIFKEFEDLVTNLDRNCRQISLYSYKNPFRYTYSYWWYFFIWSMEKTVANRLVKHNYEQ